MRTYQFREGLRVSVVQRYESKIETYLVWLVHVEQHQILLEELLRDLIFPVVLPHKPQNLLHDLKFGSCAEPVIHNEADLL